jgi:hypothetical protein
MPSFSIKDSQTIADFIIPMTKELADQLWTAAKASDDGNASMAVYYNLQNRDNGSVKRSSSLVIVAISDAMAMCYLTEYHPRTDGKADIIVKTDQTIMGY